MAVALAVAAGIHLGAVVTHASVWMPAAIGFAIVAFAQGFGAVDALHRGRFRVFTIVTTVAVLVGWAISRSIGLPFTPLGIESITVHDAAASALELVALGALLRPTRTRSRRIFPFRRTLVSVGAGLGMLGTVAGPVGHVDHVHPGGVSGLLASTAAGRALAADPEIHLHGLTESFDLGADPERGPTSPLDATLASVASQPGSLAYGADGALWIAHRSGFVTRLRDGDPPLRVTIDGSPTGIVVAFGRVWVTDIANDQVLVLDPVDGEVLEGIAVGVGPIAITATPARIWITTITDGWLQAIDPVRLRVGPGIPVGFGPISLTADGSALVVVNSLDRQVRLIRTVAGEATLSTPIDVGAGASDAVFTRDAVWVANASDGTVNRIDRGSLTVTATFTVDDISQPGLGPTAITSDGRSGVFVANNQDRSVRTISIDGTVSEPRFFGTLRSSTPTRQDVIVRGSELILTDFEASTVARMPLDDPEGIA